MFSSNYRIMYGPTMQSRRLTARLFDEMHVFNKFSTIMGKHNEFGREGEKMAADFLIKNGYQIICKNYRYLKAEIDIIAKKGDILAIVEVRARSNDKIIPIADTITKKKIKLLVMGADYYVTDNELDMEVRFDVITILKNRFKCEIDHLESAFYHF